MFNFLQNLKKNWKIMLMSCYDSIGIYLSNELKNTKKHHLELIFRRILLTINLFGGRNFIYNIMKIILASTVLLGGKSSKMIEYFNSIKYIWIVKRYKKKI